MDCTKREASYGLLKCSFSIRQLAYDVHPDFLDEYIKIGERTSRTLDHFCQAVMKIYGPEFLRKPTVTDIEKVYQHHKEKHGFSGILESLDYMDWSGSVVHMACSLRCCWVEQRHQSLLFNDLKIGQAPEIPFVANGVTYPCGYYLVDGIYLELATLVKTIPEPAVNDQK
nr:hypothetical protein [Tanacetum cinerariifolium]GFB31140.1 hypothetical protein [Tanacetum cinerariifolium]